MTFHEVLFVSSIVAACVSVSLCIVLFMRSRTDVRRLAQVDRVRENYRQITKESNDSLFVIDIADGRILECNKRAAELLGYSEGTLRTLTLFDIHPREMLNASSVVIADTWERGGLVYQHLPYKTMAGELIQMESSAKVMPYDGRPAITIYARDIRERLRLEAEIQRQSRELEQKNQDMTDSIVYARRIQRAILPADETVKAAFPDSFVLYMPKDIVSGDFYWAAQHQGINFLAVADCTGHGVPGAFMSMLGTTLLKEIVQNRNVTQPHFILEMLNAEVRKALRQDEAGSQTMDGMDIALIAHNPATRKVEYSGAYRPMLYFQRDAAAEAYTLVDVEPERQAIGGKQDEHYRTFTLHTLDARPGDTLYLFTDGYADQFGGEAGRKYMSKKFGRLLQDVVALPVAEQHTRLATEHTEWRGIHEQMDDILVAGIRL